MGCVERSWSYCAEGVQVQVGAAVCAGREGGQAAGTVSSVETLVYCLLYLTAGRVKLNNSKSKITNRS